MSALGGSDSPRAVTKLWALARAPSLPDVVVVSDKLVVQQSATEPEVELRAMAASGPVDEDLEVGARGGSSHTELPSPDAAAGTAQDMGFGRDVAITGAPVMTRTADAFATMAKAEPGRVFEAPPRVLDISCGPPLGGKGHMQDRSRSPASTMRCRSTTSLWPRWSFRSSQLYSLPHLCGW